MFSQPKCNFCSGDNDNYDPRYDAALKLLGLAGWRKNAVPAFLWSSILPFKVKCKLDSLATCTKCRERLDNFRKTKCP